MKRWLAIVIAIPVLIYVSLVTASVLGWGQQTNWDGMVTTSWFCVNGPVLPDVHRPAWGSHDHPCSPAEIANACRYRAQVEPAVMPEYCR